jgi:hypothetical protein
VSNSSSDTFELQAAIDSLLQDQPVFPVLNQILYELANGNTSVLGGGGGGVTIDAVVGIPYLCSDYGEYKRTLFIEIETDTLQKLRIIHGLVSTNHCRPGLK